MAVAKKKKRRTTQKKKSRKPSLPGRSTRRSSKKSQARSWADEAAALFFFALSAFLALSIISYQFSSDTFLEIEQPGAFRNLIGPVGHFTATLLTGFFGWCSLVLALWSACIGYFFWAHRGKKTSWEIHSPVHLFAGLAGTLMFSCAIGAIFGGSEWGGSLGELIAYPLGKFFNGTGAGLISGAFLLIFIAMAMQKSVGEVMQGIALSIYRSIVFVLTRLPVVIWDLAVSAFYWVVYGVEWLYYNLGIDLFVSWLGNIRYSRKEDKHYEDEYLDDYEDDGYEEDDLAGEEFEDYEYEYEDDEPQRDLSKIKVSRRVVDDRVSKRALSKVRSRVKKQSQELDIDKVFANYEPPSIEILTPGESAIENENDDELRALSRIIELKLRDFNIAGEVTQVHPGPVITLFEFEPAAGIKVGKIASLQDDLAMSLKASSLRILAPIPNRGTVGIEVPNKVREVVRLRDLLESESLVNSDSILSVPLGKDTYGEPVVDDIATMPHLLIAGATGTGKSVCINTVLLSLLYRASPAELGLILIDPKILELSVYEGIPHLKVPVVTNPRQAKAVLEWAVNEMNRRYRLMQKYGVRSIDSYNRVARGEDSMDDRETPESAVPLGEDAVVEPGTVESIEERAEALKNDQEELFQEKMLPLAKIVIVVDELADLMLSVGREVEDLITRLAQKARAAGIHLIVATQRPSVDVVTGLIKANFPARMSFRVSSGVDSRTILNTQGAEKLLGKGDMLYLNPRAVHLKRLHGAFVSDLEVKKTIKQLKKGVKPVYDERIVEVCERALEEEKAEGGPSGDGEIEYDAFYDKAVELVMNKGQASTSMLQRAFRIGYNRAARIVDTMEAEGIVGPADGSRPREILVDSHDYGDEDTDDAA